MELLQINQKTGSKKQIYMAIKKLITYIIKSLDENSTTFILSDKKQDLPRNIQADIDFKR